MGAAAVCVTAGEGDDAATGSGAMANLELLPRRAMLIRGGRIVSAGCFLPLSKNSALDKNLGTRHRAACGLTEETDAHVFVVSEENRSVGMAHSGILDLDLD